MARWTPGMPSPNPHGRPRKHASLSEHIEAQLNKSAFAARLVDISMGRIPGIPALVQASCMRMILDRVDGICVRKEDMERKVEVVVSYVNDFDGEPPINVTPVAAIEVGDSED